MWFIVVEVEQETSAPPPEKNPGSAPGMLLFFLQYRSCDSTLENRFLSFYSRAHQRIKKRTVSWKTNIPSYELKRFITPRTLGKIGRRFYDLFVITVSARLTLPYLPKSSLSNDLKVVQRSRPSLFLCLSIP